ENGCAWQGSGSHRLSPTARFYFVLHSVHGSIRPDPIGRPSGTRIICCALPSAEALGSVRSPLPGLLLAADGVPSFAKPKAKSQKPRAEIQKPAKSPRAESEPNRSGLLPQNPLRQLRARNRDLFAGGQMLEREG